MSVQLILQSRGELLPAVAPPHLSPVDWYQHERSVVVCSPSGCQAWLGEDLGRPVVMVWASGEMH